MSVNPEEGRDSTVGNLCHRSTSRFTQLAPCRKSQACDRVSDKKLGLWRTLSLRTLRLDKHRPSRLSAVQHLPSIYHLFLSWAALKASKHPPGSQVQTTAAWEIRIGPSGDERLQKEDVGAVIANERSTATDSDLAIGAAVACQKPRSTAQPTWRQGRTDPRSPAHYAQTERRKRRGDKYVQKIALALNYLDIGKNDQAVKLHCARCLQFITRKLIGRDELPF